MRIYGTAISSNAIAGLEAIPPTVAVPAAASPSPVTGTTAALSVLGADDAGASTLTYTWATAGTPPAPVTFSANGSNAAQNTTATFTAAGTYNFLVTITNPAGLTATSSVSVTVNQTLDEHQGEPEVGKSFRGDAAVHGHRNGSVRQRRGAACIDLDRGRRRQHRCQ